MGPMYNSSFTGDSVPWSLPPRSPGVVPAARPAHTDRYQVSVERTCSSRRSGYLIVPDVVSPPEIAELARAHRGPHAGPPARAADQALRTVRLKRKAVVVNDLGAPPDI